MARLADLRSEYHRRLFAELVAVRSGTDIPNIADKSSPASVKISQHLLSQLNYPQAPKCQTPQRIGTRFADITCDFLRQAFELLNPVRPGTWFFSTSQAAAGITAFSQYQHIADLQRVIATNPEVRTALGGDYLITPDIIVGRAPEPDEAFNVSDSVLDDDERVARNAPLRLANADDQTLILHASISVKWTMRSDRAQNTRTEALNLIRNRKGTTPHIVAVTFEPLPTRLASIAMGTGDLDCTYHVALPELLDSARHADAGSSFDLLQELVEGRRIRDITDLPLDLAV
jgi:hypothetical protein